MSQHEARTQQGLEFVAVVCRANDVDELPERRRPAIELQ